MDVNWEAFGAIAEMLGAIGVLATLAYLGMQVRQSKRATEANTRQMRGQAFVALSQAVRDQVTWLRDNPDGFVTVVKAQDDWDSLNEEEQRFAMVWNLDEFNYHELAYVLWQEGAIDEESYLERERYALSLLLQKGRRTWWDNYVYLLDQRFIDRINSQLAKADELNLKPMIENQPMYRPPTKEIDS